MYKSKYNKRGCQATMVKGNKVFISVENNQADFCLNSFGHLASDFTMLMQQQDNLMYQRLLSDMQAKYYDGLPKGTTFEDAVKLLRPRWCQSPAEMDRFEQYCIDNALDVYKKLKENTDQEVIDSMNQVPPTSSESVVKAPPSPSESVVS